jgi:rRNA maturation endonuclease Nob1
MTTLVRRCLACGATYPPDGHACPRCASHAGEVEEQTSSSSSTSPRRASSARPAERSRAKP